MSWDRHEFWCYCGLVFWTARGLSEHQREDHKPAPRPEGRES